MLLKKIEITITPRPLLLTQVLLRYRPDRLLGNIIYHSLQWYHVYIVPGRVPVDRSDDSIDSFSGGYTQSFLQNPYYFMFASLAKPDDDTELHWLKVG